MITVITIIMIIIMIIIMNIIITIVTMIIKTLSGSVGFVGGNRCSADAMSRCTDPLR